MQSEFTGEYKKTIGTDFMRKEIYLDSVGEEVSIVTGIHSLWLVDCEVVRGTAGLRSP